MNTEFKEEEMTVKIGINGFGRIGRIVLREAAKTNNYEFVGINDLVPPKTLAYLLKYDSVHGKFPGEIKATDNSIIVNGKEIPITSEKDPSNLPWGKVGADVVFECTGIFTTQEMAGKHLSAGAKKVIISAPAKDKETPTFVYGVNHEEYDPSKDNIISNASCTTNCLAPFAKVLNDNYGIEKGFMTTIHAYTADQKLVDAPHKDLRRARAAALSQVPTTTGAAKAVGLVLPDLKGKLDGMAMRVPTADVSCVDLVVMLKKETTKEEVNAAIKRASENELKGILGYNEEPLVSIDFVSDPRSSIVDAPSTYVNGNMVKILSWYDNEYGFSARMLDMANYLGSKL